ncbi:MAG: cache domain-containing protein [Limnospira sp.]
MKKYISIRYVIPLLIVVPLVVATGTTAVLAFYSGRRAVESLISELSKKALNSIEKHVDTYLKAPQIVNRLNFITIENNLIDPTDFDLLTRYFNDQVATINGLSHIYLGTANGDFIGVKRQADGTRELILGNAETQGRRNRYQLDSSGQRVEAIGTLEDRYDPRVRPWYKEALKVGDLTWSPVYVFGSTLELGMTSAIPVRNIRGDTVGVLGIDLGLKDLSNFLRSLEISPRGMAFIIDRAGNVVASSTDEQPFLNENGENRRLPALESREPVIRDTLKNLLDTESSLMQIQEPIAISFSWQNQRQLVQVVPLQSNGLDWLIVVVIPEEDFMQLIYNNLRFTAIVGLGVMVVAVGLGAIASLWIVRPIDNLAQGAKAIKSNSFDPHSLKNTASRPDEMGELGQAFLEMADIVDAREKSLTEKLESLRDQQEQWRRTLHQNKDLNRDRFDELIERARQSRNNN